MRVHRALIACGLVFLLAACRPTSDSARSELVVFSASSLAETFGAIGKAYERAHPDVDVRFSFAGSQVLRLQLEHGALADVFASADPRQMEALKTAGLVMDSQVFARNELVVVVPADNPAGIDSFADLSNTSRLVVGAKDAPIGGYTRSMLERATTALGPEFVAGVREHIVSEENNVRLVRAKIEMGEADAAVVYRTDVSTGLLAVSIPDSVNVRANYPIASLSNTSNAEEAMRFIRFVRSPEAQQILRSHGFSEEAE